MTSKYVILLPGLDGNVDLHADFMHHAPPDTTVSPISLPDEPLDYAGLCDYVSAVIENSDAPDSLHLIAESFSGPLAILLAHRKPELIQRLTLVASFAKSPAPWFAHYFPWKQITRRKLPNFAASYYFGVDQELASQLQSAIQSTSPETLEYRIRSVLKVDVREQLSQFECPIGYLRATKDRLVPYRASSTILAANKNTVVHEIEASHLVLQTKPKEAWYRLNNAEYLY